MRRILRQSFALTSLQSRISTTHINSTTSKLHFETQIRKYSTEYPVISVKDVRTEESIDKTVTIRGWVRSFRDQKQVAFIEVNDGSCLKNAQVVLPPHMLTKYSSFVTIFLTICSVSFGCSIQVRGKVIKSPAKGQITEITVDENDANAIKVLGTCDVSTYPLQKKNSSAEFLRNIAHLRPRTNTTSAMIRIRNVASMAIHEYFQNENFYLVNTPIITSSDCEGAGEQFQIVESLKEGQKLNSETFEAMSTNFFGSKTFLTVSGQLEAEIFASAMSNVYTFGPTFRAEHSNTTRHLSEFWMVEMEMAFATLKELVQHGEGLVKHVIKKVLDRCSEDLQMFNAFHDKGLLERLTHTLETPFNVITYTQAIEILEKSGQTFKFPVNWGKNLQSEHEVYLCKHLGGPTFVTNYPRLIKPFYARVDDSPSDKQTVAAVDLLVPKLGELIGGSEREERLDLLEENTKLAGLNAETYAWYMDLRRYGSVPHGGFGLGFERLILYLTGLENIRDAIPLPRAPGYCKF
jgi:asparaginyl-tRNA synthetase